MPLLATRVFRAYRVVAAQLLRSIWILLALAVDAAPTMVNGLMRAEPEIAVLCTDVTTTLSSRVLSAVADTICETAPCAAKCNVIVDVAAKP